MVRKYSTHLNLSGSFAPAKKEMWTPSNATNKENMPFDVNQETITPRVSHFAAEMNVKNLWGKQTTQLEELIINPNGRIAANFLFRVRLQYRQLRRHLFLLS